MLDGYPHRWICVLGPVAVLTPAGAAFAPRRAAPRTLLALLASRWGRVWPADELAEALWGADPPANPVAALQSQVFRLRRVLGEGWVETVGAGYRLGGPPERVDAALFEHLLRVADTAAGPEVLAVLDQALGLWRGYAYADTGEHPDLVAEAQRLERLRRAAAAARVELLLRLGHAERAAGAAADLVADEPWAEAPVRMLGEALSAAGRHADALAQFRAFRLRLRDELAIEPTAALRGAEEAVLRHLDPRPRAAATIRLPGNSFVGRDLELADLVTRLGPGRLVTVVGPGGVGKTRLALHAAALAADGYPDGLYVCELAAIAGDVPSAVAGALRVERRFGQSKTDCVVEFLRPRRILLVLDNCEHVADEVRVLLGSVGAVALDVAVLTTSRVRVGATGETCVELAPLATESFDGGVAAGVELFVDRLRALRVGLDLDGEGMAAIGALVRRADGLPLAIELATARCLVRSPIEVAAEWAARDPVDPRRSVVGELGSRPDTARHRSIDAMVGWSYDLLPPERREVFEVLSVFAGGWDAAAAGALTEEAADLSGLVEQSLVVVSERSGGLRYSMLEPVRQFAAHRLDERGVGPAVRARHAAWAAEFGEALEAGLRTAAEGRWHRRADAELANLRAAHDWALDHEPGLALRLAGLYWFALWHAPAEVLDRTAEAVARYGDRDDPALPAALATAAVGAWRRGDLVGAAALGERALSAAPARDHPVARFGWEALADAALFAGDHDRAMECYAAATAAARRAGDEAFVVEASLGRALCLGYAGRIEEARTAIEVQRDPTARLANPTCNAFADYVTAEATLPGQAGYAVRLLERAAATASAAHSEFLADECLLTAAARRVAVGDALGAAPSLYTLVERWHRAGNWNQQWTTLAICADALAALDRAEEAAVLAAAVALRAEQAVRYALEALASVCSPGTGP